MNHKQSSPEATWSLIEESSIQNLVKVESLKTVSHEIQITKESVHILDNTPIKSKCKSIILSHEISKIRAPDTLSPLHMSLDNSLDDNPLSLEDKKIDFNNVDLKFLTENASQFDFTANATKVGDSSTSFKRVDSGFNENTFYANGSSYYESAIKPSELTATNIFKGNNSKTALKEISNVPWMRIDSGFRDDNSGDGVFYPVNESSMKKLPSFRFSEALVDKENVVAEDFDKFLVQSSSKNEAMSMSDIFTDDMTFNCNFSSTPSKNKSRKAQ